MKIATLSFLSIKLVYYVFNIYIHFNKIISFEQLNISFIINFTIKTKHPPSNNYWWRVFKLFPRQKDFYSSPFVQFTFQLNATFMEHHPMLDYGKSQTCAAGFFKVTFINPVKAFKNPLFISTADTAAGILKCCLLYTSDAADEL